MEKERVSSQVIDPDLVEMSGLHAYLNYDVDYEFEINSNVYTVINTNYDDATGLDALTVQSIETEEIFIIYVGTDFHGKYGWKDIETNINLLNEVVPAQLEAADDYYVEMEKKFGEISAVAGNSLGGALANGVAIEHEVRSVTLNPALLPDGMIDPNKDYSYMTNYIGEYDILNQALRAGGLDNRVPGNQHTIYNGVALKSAIGPNHTGYARDENGQHVPYITIGKKGDPGYGRIYMDAHSHIVTSLWTGQPLYGGSGQRIAINHETLLHLGESMETTVLERLNLARDYINHSLEIVDDQAAKFPERVNSLREIFLSLFESADGGTLLQGINGGNSLFKQMVKLLHSIIDSAEESCRSLNVILNSAPMELIEHLTKTDISVESIFEGIRGYIYQLEDEVDQLSGFVDHVLFTMIDNVFKGGQDLFHDVVVQELVGHYEYIDRNEKMLNRQVVQYKSQVEESAKAFAARDQNLGHAIESKGGGIAETQKVEGSDVFELEDSPYLLLTMRLKEIHVNSSVEMLKSRSTPLLFAILEVFNWIIMTLEGLGHSAKLVVEGATNIHLYGNPKNLIRSIFTDYDERVKQKVREATGFLDEWLDVLSGLRTGVTTLQLRYPYLVDELRPYIDSLIFEKFAFYNVHLYNSSANAILKEMQIVFEDVGVQLSEHEADFVNVLEEKAKKVKSNMNVLELQVERGTFL